MKVERLEDLQVWQRALAFADAVSALTREAVFQRDRKLREQLDDCCDSLVSNIAEGFGQATDRAFARYLFISKGSALEAAGHLAVGFGRQYLTQDRYHSLAREAFEIAKMLNGLIRYLLRSDWRDRT